MDIRPIALAAALLAGAALPAVEPWAGAMPAGAVAQADATLALSGGAATVRVCHPAAGDGPWPLVIFSHGLAGSREGYGFLAQRWAAHGYVVVRPDHPGSDTASFRGLGPGKLPQALRAAALDPAVMEARPRLVARLIDGLDELERQVPALAGRIDRARIGVGGHSFGAYTTMWVAGLQIRGPGRGPLDWSDPRPRAFAALSPGGRGAFSQDADWAGITRPVLVMTGSDDVQPAFLARPGGAKQDGQWRRQAFDLMAPGGKLLVWFDGARHCTYSAGAGNLLTGEAAPDPAQVEAVAVATLAWWDARLRDHPGAQAWLADPGAAAALGPWAAISAR